MMRRLLIAAAGLALLAPAALAPVALGQTAPAAGQLPANQTMAAPLPGAGRLVDMPPPPSPSPGGPHGGPNGGPGGPGTPPPPPPPRGAHFYIERGDARIDVKCADQDSTQACATVVEAMLDKLAAMPARN